jgi:hypothetical protein
MKRVKVTGRQRAQRRIDRAATVAAELEPLFGQLAEVERQCDSIQDSARADGATVVTGGTSSQEGAFYARPRRSHSG